MNAVTFPFPRAAFGVAASAVHADAHIGTAMDELSDAAGALYDRRTVLSDRERRAEAAIRNAQVALAHARNLLSPLMKETVQ